MYTGVEIRIEADSSPKRNAVLVGGTGPKDPGIAIARSCIRGGARGGSTTWSISSTKVGLPIT
jgi:hypothetical protein